MFVLVCYQDMFISEGLLVPGYGNFWHRSWFLVPLGGPKGQIICFSYSFHISGYTFLLNKIVWIFGTKCFWVGGPWAAATFGLFSKLHVAVALFRSRIDPSLCDAKMSVMKMSIFLASLWGVVQIIESDLLRVECLISI